MTDRDIFVVVVVITTVVGVVVGHLVGRGMDRSHRACSQHCWHDTSDFWVHEKRRCCRCGHRESKRAVRVPVEGHGPYHTVTEERWR